MSICMILQRNLGGIKKEHAIYFSACTLGESCVANYLLQFSVCFVFHSLVTTCNLLVLHHEVLFICIIHRSNAIKMHLNHFVFHTHNAVQYEQLSMMHSLVFDVSE